MGGNVIPITSFTYQNVGINIDIEPRVHHNKEVTLKLRVEVSSLSGQVAAGGGVTQPIIGTREIETQIRLKDGETNLLAGLIRQEERSSLSSVPGLGHIPVLKHLFGNNDTSIQQTDIVLTLTPHIIRVPDITEADLKPLWIGTDQDVGLRGISRTSPFGTPFETNGEEDETPPAPEKETVGAPPAGTIVPVPAAPARAEAERPAPPEAPPSHAGTGGAAPSDASPTPPSPPRAVVSFKEASLFAKVGTSFNVQVLIADATNVGSVPFHLSYDPKFLEFVPPAAEGGFLKSDGASTIFNAQASTTNEIFVALARVGVPTGASVSGSPKLLCVFQFQALATGRTSLAFTEASVLDPAGKPLPADFAPGLQVIVQP